MIISQLGEYVEDMNEIKEIVKLVLNFFHSPNSMIRYAVCHCLGQLSLDLQPEFQTELQELLIRLLCQAIKDQVYFNILIIFIMKFRFLKLLDMQLQLLEILLKE